MKNTACKAKVLQPKRKRCCFVLYTAGPFKWWPMGHMWPEATQVAQPEKQSITEDNTLQEPTEIPTDLQCNTPCSLPTFNP